MLLKIKKLILAYKKIKPHLANFFKLNGYIVGNIKLIKIFIVSGLKCTYGAILHNMSNGIEKHELQDLKYLIFAPNFTSNSAGIYCLYKLCHDLREKGFPAAIYGSTVTTNSLDAPLIVDQKAIKKLRKRNDICVIYPETYVGNPSDFKNVARWVLNRPGLLSGDEVYHHNEKVFVYSDCYIPYIKNHIQGKLYMPTFDRSIFYPPPSNIKTETRQLSCYYVGKSKFIEGYFDPKETFEITRLSPEKKELGKLFRTAKTLYCFDNSTALIYEAIACGCPVRIIPDGTQTWDDYKKLELGTTGIFWDEPTTNLTQETITTLINKIKSSEAQYKIELDKFIKLTSLVPALSM